MTAKHHNEVATDAAKPRRVAFIGSKIRTPPLPQWWIERDRLTGSLDPDRYSRIAITGPAGSGKTSLLTRWAQDRQLDSITAWMSIDPRDNSAARFWGHLLESLQRSSPELGLEARGALVGGSDVVDTVVPLLLDDLALVDARVVICLDDLHLIEPFGREAIDLLLDGAPAGTTVATASRAGLTRSETRAVVNGRAIHISSADLRFMPDEAEALVSGVAGDGLDAQSREAIHQIAGGWAAPLRLYASRIADVGGTAPVPPETDSTIADYIRSEVVDLVDVEDLPAVALLAGLDRFSAAMVDELLPEAAHFLRSDERERLAIVDLGAGWFKIHDLVRGALSDVPLSGGTRNRLAEIADWHASRNYAEEAIVCAVRAEDWDRGAEFLNASWLGFVESGRIESLLEHASAFPARIRDHDERVLVTLGWFYGLVGDLSNRDRVMGLLDARESTGPLPDGSESSEQAAAVNRALMPTDQSSSSYYAAEAMRLTPPSSPWYAFALAGTGVACDAAGDAKGTYRAWLEASRALPEVFAIPTLGGAAIAAADLGEFDRARELSERARQRRSESGFDHIPWIAMHEIAAGLVELDAGDPKTALNRFEVAATGVSGMIEPYPFIRSMLGIAECHRVMGNRRDAAEAVRAAEIRADEAGEVGDHYDALIAEARRRCAQERPLAHAAALEHLTDRELSVLRLLAATQLTQSEIAENLFVSRNTVKTHTQSIYRKLHVRSRGRAVERARQLGLVG
ncbi:MAG: LuxR C-terminal-related transcriptional regulator [Acidimicrobiia bacterium]|nr:LuxR C-terminal-related transcriptional regulator [Acidimicrobiia bacterium]